VVWLFATFSLMLPNAADWADKPLTAVFKAPNRDMRNSCEAGGG
jgi:hypothetical protein